MDAIFAAARYLRAAGAATDLHAAILAYNHSEEYVASVLLRAKLISSYPKSVIATLTGLTDGRLPVSGKQVAWAASTATASATELPAGAGAGPATGVYPSKPATSGSPLSLAPAAAAAAATAKSPATAQTLQFAEVTSAPNAAVVAVQDGRVVGLGQSRALGRYLVLRDVYGDLFTYAGLGSIAPSYPLAKPPRAPVNSPVVEAASTRDPTPSRPATAGSRPAVTLKVKAATHARGAKRQLRRPACSKAARTKPPRPYWARSVCSPAPATPTRWPPASSAARSAAARRGARRAPLRRGSVVATGTVLGHVRLPLGAKAGHLRFAIRPAGDPATIDPGRSSPTGRSSRLPCIRRGPRHRTHCSAPRRAMCC